MRILYLVPHVPNPTKIRSYNQIRGLIDAGHTLLVATFVRGEQDRMRLERLRATGAEVIGVPMPRARMIRNASGRLLSGQPVQSRLLYSPDFAAQVEAAARRFQPDIVHVEHLRMAQYGLRLKADYPVVWDAVDNLAQLHRQARDASSSLPYRLFSALEAARMPAYERWLTGQFAVTLVISGQDLALFRQDNPAAERIRLVPFGLPIMSLPDDVTRTPDTLIMTGTLDYDPNVTSALYFARHVLPAVLAARPATRLQLVGANPRGSIRRLASKRIEVTGRVPDLNAYLAAATAAVAPIRYGSGLQIKVIEAFQTATPVVATPIALRSLDVRDGEHVLIADSPDAFSDALVRLLDDDALRSRLGAAGRAYVEAHHDLTHTTGLLLDAYRAAM